MIEAGSADPIPCPGIVIGGGSGGGLAVRLLFAHC